MPLTVRDRRLRTLTARDYRMVERRPQRFGGAAELAALEASGVAPVHLPAAGGALLGALQASGTSFALLSGSASAALAALEASGLTAAQIRALEGSGELAALLAAGTARSALQGGGGAELAALEANGESSVARFSPSMVPEVAAGYFWDPAQAVNSDQATFLLPEGNGKSTHNLITPSAAAAPQITTLNGHAVIQYLNQTAPIIDEISRAAGNVQRGFTGAAMLWGWVSCSAGPGMVFNHGRSNHFFGLSVGSSDLRAYVNDGSAKEFRYPLPPGGLVTPFYYEALFIPSESSPTNRLQLTVNRAAVTPTLAPSLGTSMLDTAGVLNCCGVTGDGSGFNIAANCIVGVWGLTNGIPSDAHRNALFNHRRLAP